MDQALGEKYGAKIPRLETLQILSKVENRISDPNQLRVYFDELSLAAQVALERREPGPADLAGESERCLALYQGALAPSQVRLIFSSTGWTDSVTEDFQVRIHPS